MILSYSKSLYFEILYFSLPFSSLRSPSLPFTSLLRFAAKRRKEAKSSSLPFFPSQRSDGSEGSEVRGEAKRREEKKIRTNFYTTNLFVFIYIIYTYNLTKLFIVRLRSASPLTSLPSLPSLRCEGLRREVEEKGWLYKYKKYNRINNPSFRIS